MKKIKLIKKICVVMSLVFTFAIFSISVYAQNNGYEASTVILPENFYELSLEEQKEWLRNNPSDVNEDQAFYAEKIDIPMTMSTDPNRIYYTAYADSLLTNYGEPLYGFRVRYIWSVASNNISNSIALESITVVNEAKYYQPANGFFGPYKTGSPVTGGAFISCEVKTRFNHHFANVTLFQLATLWTDGIHNITTHTLGVN